MNKKTIIAVVLILIMIFSLVAVFAFNEPKDKDVVSMDNPKEISVKSNNQYKSNSNWKTEGKDYGVEEYVNNSIKEDIIFEDGDDLQITRVKNKNIKLYKNDELVFEDKWFIYDSIDFEDKFGKMEEKKKFKIINSSEEHLAKGVVLHQEYAIEDRERNILGNLDKHTTVRKSNITFQTEVTGNFVNESMLLSIYLPEAIGSNEDLSCSFEASGYYFDFCESNTEFIKSFGKEIFVGFGKLSKNNEFKFGFIKT